MLMSASPPPDQAMVPAPADVRGHDNERQILQHRQWISVDHFLLPSRARTRDLPIPVISEQVDLHRPSTTVGRKAINPVIQPGELECRSCPATRRAAPERFCNCRDEGIKKAVEGARRIPRATRTVPA
jgi:hypothetical protein